MNAPHAISPAELRGSAYAAFAAGDWTKGRRLTAAAERLEAEANYHDAKELSGHFSRPALDAFREYRIATTNLVRLDDGTH